MTESFDEYFERHNGKTVKLDGIGYKIRCISFKSKYPRPHRHTLISLEPVNKRSEAYRKTKRKLGDDWAIDGRELSDKSLTQIAKQLGDLR